MKTSLLLALLMISAINSVYSAGQNDTIWNQKDEKGQKQGFWKISYENGAIKYQGFFKNNKPVGNFKRFYDDGTIKAIQYYYTDGVSVYTELYYNNGVLAAKGKYVNSLKDSIWNYYSYYDKSLKLTENYSLGKKHGVSKKFYENGQLAEEIDWKNNMKDGKWIQYFPNADTLLKAIFVNDSRQGLFVTYYPGNKIESKGNFSKNLMEGEWEYFDLNGNLKMKTQYIKGENQNKAAVEKAQEEFFKKIEENKGKIPEPDETNFMPQ